MEQPDSECVWTELEQKLNIGRNFPVAMMIPDHFASCEHPENKFFQSLGKAATSFLVSKITRENALFEGYISTFLSIRNCSNIFHGSKK